MDKDKNDFLYTPKIGYDRNYYSEKIFDEDILDKNKNTEEDLNNEDSSSNKYEEVDNLITSISNSLPFLPDNIIKSFSPPFLGAINSFNLIPEDIFSVDDSSEITIDTTPNEIIINPNLEEAPKDPFKIGGNDLVIEIKKEIIPIEEILEKEYENDMLDIIHDYLVKFKKVLDKFILNLLTNTSILDKSIVMKSDFETDKIKNKDLMHLNDIKIKSEILIKQNVTLCNKIFDLDETAIHFKMCKIASEERKRYFKENFIKSENIVEMNSNRLLRESQIVSKRKYEQSFKNLYKFLNSSTILLEKCLDLTVKEMTSKTILINKEGEKNNGINTKQ